MTACKAFADILQAKNIVLNVMRTCANFPAGRLIIAQVTVSFLMISEDRIDRLEMPLARLLLALTHHPDCQWDFAGLKDIARCAVILLICTKLIQSRFIELYLDCVATRDNVGLLYSMAGKIKTVKDANEEITDNTVRALKQCRLWVILTFCRICTA